MAGHLEVTPGYGVRITGVDCIEEAIHVVADAANMQDGAIKQRSNALWILARSILALQTRWGDDFFYQAINEKMSPYTVNLAIKTAREFTPDEVRGLPSLYYSHFAEVAKRSKLSHDERMEILWSANAQDLSVRAAREMADLYIHLRDGTEPKRKPKYLVALRDGESYLAHRLDGDEDGQCYKIGANPKRIIGFEVDGEPILEDIPIRE